MLTPFPILAAWSDQWLRDARLANRNAAAQLLLLTTFEK